MGLAINECPASEIPQVIAELTSSFYSNILAPYPFPAHFKRRQGGCLSNVTSSEKIYLWNAAVISQFSEQLSSFVGIKKKFDDALITGDLRQCDTHLLKIEQSFGQSLWLIKNKILLLQLREGLAAQKEYLQRFLETQNPTELSSFIVFYKSLSCEQNVSFQKISEELKEIFLIFNLGGDYLRYHILPYQIDKINQTHNVVLMEEASPIIDRFESIVEMATLEYARSNFPSGGYVRFALSLLHSVEDPRIKDLLYFSDVQNLGDMCKWINPAFDQYTEGQSNTEFQFTERVFELGAIMELSLTESHIRKGIPEPVRSIVDAIKNVITLTEKRHSAEEYLKKIGLMYAPHAITTILATFLQRSNFIMDLKNYSQLDCLEALKGGFENPWAVAILAHHKNGQAGLAILAEIKSLSTTLRLVLALHSDYADGVCQIEALPIPKNRSETYKGHIALKNHKYNDALTFYQNAAKTSIHSYSIRRIKPFLFIGFLRLRKYQECVDLVLSSCLNAEWNLELYPIQELVDELKKCTNICSIEFTLMVFLATRNSTKITTSLSDVFENFLSAELGKRPSELLSKKNKFAHEHFIYFLRHVCSLKVMDSLTEFDGVVDLENERMVICRALSELDPNNVQIYETEIKQITRDANNAELLRLVQSSKIYLDEEGILEYYEENFKDLFNRFIEYKSTPEMWKSLVNKPKVDYVYKTKVVVDDEDKSELEVLLEDILDKFARQFAAHPAYGMDIHINTGIRHHTFEGHFRGAFDRESLLCYRATKDADYELPPIWKNHLEKTSAKAITLIQDAFVQFTNNVVTEINEYLTHCLYFYEPEIRPHGLINLYVTKEDLVIFKEDVWQCNTSEEFSKCLIDCCWRMVDRSLEQIRDKIIYKSLPNIERELSALECKISLALDATSAQILFDSIVRARTAFQSSIRDICNWFHRPGKLKRSPFDIESAIDVASTQLFNCKNVRLILSKSVKVPFQLDGKYLDGIVEVLFILLQNIIRHSDQNQNDMRGTTEIVAIGDNIKIIMSNPLGGNGLPIAVRRQAAQEAMDRYKADHEQILDIAGKTSGSGLSKVWRTLQFTLRKESTLTLEILPDKGFQVELCIFSILNG